MTALSAPKFPIARTWVEQHFIETGDFTVAAEKSIKAGNYVWTLRRQGQSWTVRIEITDHVVRGPLEARLMEADGWVARLHDGAIEGIRITKEHGVTEWPQSDH